MTQQQMSQLLDVPDRTLRDWKKGRNRLYSLLESLKYEDVKEKISVPDVDDIVEFNPKEYTFNCFWQTNNISQQKVYSIISNYLGTINKIDIFTLCKEYGKSMVKSVLVDKYKKLYTQGYISTKSMDIPLYGTYSTNETYKEILGIVNDY